MATSFCYICIDTYIDIYFDIFIDIYITFTYWRSVQSFYWTLFFYLSNSSLRVAETVWMEGVFLKDYPPEAFTIKCLEVGTLVNFIILHHHHSLNVPRTRLLSWQRKAVNSGLRSISNPGWRRSRQWYIARKALLSSIRSCSLKVSNWEGRLTTWDRRSTINCTMEDLLFERSLTRMRLSTGRSECAASLCW